MDTDFVVLRLPSIYGLLALKIAKKLGKPYLVELVGCPWDSLWNHSWKGKLVAPFMFLITKLAIKNSTDVLYVTNDFLQNRYPTSGNNIGCSDVSLPKIDKAILENRMKKIGEKFDDDPIIIGTIGALNQKYKGQEFVIKAISKLNKKGYNFEYHLVGSGNHKFLQSVAEKYDSIDKVRFFGQLPHDEIFNYLDNIDVYMQPSKTEGLPRALIEALSRGCPSLGSNKGGTPELLNENCIFQSTNIDEICELLKKVNKDFMGKEAVRSFNKAYEFEKSLLDKKRKTFYHSFIKKGKYAID